MAGRGQSFVCSRRLDKPDRCSSRRTLAKRLPHMGGGASEGQALASWDAPGGLAGRGGAARGKKLRGREVPPLRLNKTPRLGPPLLPGLGTPSVVERWENRGGKGQRAPLTSQEERKGGHEISVVLVVPQGQCRVVLCWEASCGDTWRAGTRGPLEQFSRRGRSTYEKQNVPRAWPWLRRG